MLRDERDIFKKSHGLLCEPKMERFSVIDTWKKDWPIKILCKVFKVTARGYRAWRDRPASQRQRDNLITLAHNLK